MDKLNKINTFSFHIVKHLVRYGTVNWKISQVLSESGHSRSWVYKYFGSSKEEIMLHAVSNTLDTIFLGTEEMKEFHRLNGRVATYIAIRKILRRYPELNTFYFAYYHSQCSVGKLLREKESSYINNLVKPLSRLENDFQIAFIRCLQAGVANSHFLTDEQYIQMMEFVVSEDFLVNVREFPEIFKLNLEGEQKS